MNRITSGTMTHSRVMSTMAGSKEKLVIIGSGETAELAYSYFSRDTTYQVAGFSVEKAYLHGGETLFGLPVVPFEDIEGFFEPETHKAFVAVSFTQFNRLRSRLFRATKEKGYRLCSYISPRAYVDPNVQLGENCFILENTTLQRGVKIGDNITIWTGSSIGHQSQVGENCFLAMHVAISGFCTVGENCFFGVNSCTSNNLKVAPDCIIGAGAVLISNTTKGGIYIGNPAKPLPNKTTTVFIEGKETI